MKIEIGNILEHLQMLSTKTFVVKKMVYPSQRLDAKPVESCVCAAAPTPVAFSAGSIAAEPPLQRRRGVEERSGSCRPCCRCFSESASPSVSFPRSLAPQSVASVVRRALLRCFLRFSLRPSSSQNSFAKQEERHRHKMEKSEAAEARRG